MNEATKQLFEFVTAGFWGNGLNFPEIVEKVKKFIDDGADITAVNENNFNILQVALKVESPELPLNSTIMISGGYEMGSAFMVEACLQNGFQCSKDDLTNLLSVYCCECYELEPGDLKLICTLLEKGADWNCQPSGEPHLLEVIAHNNITWYGYNENCLGDNLKDWRYELLCAYYDAGGDLYVKNDAGKYVWEAHELTLTALAFFLEKNVNISAADVERHLQYQEEHNDAYECVWEVDTYWDWESIHLTESSRYKAVIGILLNSAEKYPCILKSLVKTIPGFHFFSPEDNIQKIEKDFFKPTKISLQLIKEKYGDLRKVTDEIGNLIQEKDPILADVFDFLLPDYPEITEYFPWNKLSGENWRDFLDAQPQWADKCDWDKLNDDDWEYLLLMHPQLEKYRK